MFETRLRKEGEVRLATALLVLECRTSHRSLSCSGYFDPSNRGLGLVNGKCPSLVQYARLSQLNDEKMQMMNCASAKEGELGQMGQFVSHNNRNKKWTKIESQSGVEADTWVGGYTRRI